MTIKKKRQPVKKPKIAKRRTKAASKKPKNVRRRTLRVLKKLDGLGRAPYVRGSSTSRGAAESIEDRRLAMLLAVRNFVEKQKTYGATCDEVEAALGLLHQTASARIYDLKENHPPLLVKSGKLRLTRHGCPAVVHVVPKYKRKA